MVRIRLISITIFAILAFYSTKTHAQWVKTNGPFGGEIVSIDVNTNGYLYATLQDWGIFPPEINNRVFLSTDEGKTWSSISGTIPVSNSYRFAFTKDAGVYIGTNLGLYFSGNNGSSWSNILNQEITGVSVTSKGTIIAG
ncbi:MAG: WD40/YVTN/BNR-like repeat-containing protein [Ignavibacteriaceae bacterium]